MPLLCFAFAFPAVAGAAVQVTCKPGTLSFGKVAIGQQKSLSATLTNTGSSSIKVASIKIGNELFAVSGLSLPVTLKAHASTAFNVAFTPKTSHYEPGALTFTVGSGSALSVSVSGQGVSNWSLAASPSSVAFGNVSVGSKSTLTVTLTNQGASPVAISQLLKPALEFSVSGPALPISLDAGQSAAFQVTFAPKWRGEHESRFAVTSASDPIFAVPLSGNGGGGGGGTSTKLTVAPATLSFGSVTVGDNSTQEGTITATGGSVTISGGSLGSSLFSLSGITLPLTLTAGQSASFDVTFTPKAGGTATSNLKFSSTASDSPTSEALKGSGVESAYTVSLSWNASTSEVAGYNVYRSSSLSGTYSKLNSRPDATTAFTDSTVNSGATYYYDVTSVSSSGMESSPCSPVEVTVN